MSIDFLLDSHPLSGAKNDEYIKKYTPLKYQIEKQKTIKKNRVTVQLICTATGII